MPQKGYRNVSIISVVSDLLFSSLWNNNSLLFLDVLVTERNPTLSTKAYRKLTHTGNYVHSESSHPADVEIGVVNSLFSRAADMISLTRLGSLDVIWHLVIIHNIS
jgi:hypothetical protein